MIPVPFDPVPGPARRRLIAAGAALLAAATTAAAAAGPLQITTAMMVEARSSAPDGTTRVTLVKPVRVTPGDRVVFVLGWRNSGAQPLSDVVLANPLPRGIAYRGPSPGSPAPELSVDGTQFGPLAALRVRAPDGGLRAAGPGDVTHVRWRLPSPVTAGAQGEFAFQAVLR